MDKVMTKQESYVQRRQLFKDIWDTAMHIDEREADIMNKPRVVKTLRMDEIDKCPIGKSKKQRIKNLRHVCNKILDFCDKQEADDTLYEKIAAGANQPQPTTVDNKPKKLRKMRYKRKIKKAKSLFTPQTTTTVARATTSAKEQDLLSDDSEIFRQKSQFKMKATTNTSLRPPKTPLVTLRTKITTTRGSSPDKLPKFEGYPKEVSPRRKVIKKKRHIKRKKHSNSNAT